MSHASAAYAVVLTTTNTTEHANELAAKIVKEKLAACVQIQSIQSHYMWKGETCNDPEYLLLCKTRTALYERLAAFIKLNHTYETPEIVLLPIEAGSDAYLSWIDAETNG